MVPDTSVLALCKKIAGHYEIICTLGHYPDSVLIVSKHKPNGVYFHRGIIPLTSTRLLVITEAL
jgi:hypothetical protein